MSSPRRQNRISARSKLPEMVSTPPPPPDHSSFEFNVHTDRNFPSRRTMEDAHAFAYDFGGIPDQGYFAIFDGHGGKSASRWAAANFHLVLEELLKAKPDGDVMEILAETFKQADAQMTPENGIHSGCTAVICLLRTEGSDRVLYTANVGDARAVLGRKDQALRLSHDHKASDPLEQKRIKDSGGFVSNDRVNGILAIARSLGDHEMKEWVIGTPYISRIVLHPDEDKLIVLACDGVWDVLGDEEVVRIAESLEDPMVAATKISDKALEEGSSDNISTMVVYLQRRGSGSDKDKLEATD